MQFESNVSLSSVVEFLRDSLIHVGDPAAFESSVDSLVKQGSSERQRPYVNLLHPFSVSLLTQARSTDSVSVRASLIAYWCACLFSYSPYLFGLYA